jgi:valyl-tRNA synthetase
MVLAEDGKKMSKRLKNYPDPMDVVNQVWLIEREMCKIAFYHNYIYCIDSLELMR